MLIELQFDASEVGINGSVKHTQLHIYQPFTATAELSYLERDYFVDELDDALFFPTNDLVFRHDMLIW